MTTVEIAPLTPETWDALAELFNAGGDPQWCWCQFWRKPGSNWSNTTADDNREDLRSLAAGDGIAPGLVALRTARLSGGSGSGRERGSAGSLDRGRCPSCRATTSG